MKAVQLTRRCLWKVCVDVPEVKLVVGKVFVEGLMMLLGRLPCWVGGGGRNKHWSRGIKMGILTHFFDTKRRLLNPLRRLLCA